MSAGINRPSPRLFRDPSVWLALTVTVALAGFVLFSRGAWLWNRINPLDVAEFSCPPPGTVITKSLPLSVAADPGFALQTIVGEQKGLACHLYYLSGQDTWLYGGLTNSPHLEWRAAAEGLWPLRVGSRTHGHFQIKSQTWSVDYEVTAFEEFTARVGTYPAFKILGTVLVDSVLKVQQ